MKKEILLCEGQYTIVRYPGLPERAVDFWKRIDWGTEGAIYQNLKVEEHIGLITNPALMTIEEDNELRATALFSNLPVRSGSETYNCQYIRYFATDPAVRGTGLMKRYASETMRLLSQGETRKTVYFALVERGNKASFRAVENAGYAHTGNIKTLGFSRFFPKRNTQLHKIQNEEEKNAVLEILAQQYAGHSLTQFTSVFLHEQYYVIKDVAGNLLAGCQFHRCAWKVNRMPGPMGKNIVKLLPHLPLLRRIFNPKKFQFLTFEGIFCKAGAEEMLNDLFEGLLANHGVHSAMFWMDERDPLIPRIKSVMRLGLFHQFVKANDVYMMQSFLGFSEEEQRHFTARPFYASAFDYA